MSDWTSGALLLVGGGFMLLASLGILRFPDVYSRMQAATKAATLGVAFIIIAVAVHFGQLAVSTKALMVIAFIVLTAPVAAHLIGRAAYVVGVPLWSRSVVDQLRGRYDPRAQILHGVPGELPDNPPGQ